MLAEPAFRRAPINRPAARQAWTARPAVPCPRGVTDPVHGLERQMAEVELIEQYAAHNGHADLIRGLIDGSVGW